MSDQPDRLDRERERTRLIALTLAGSALVVGAVLLALGAFLGALACAAVLAVAGAAAWRMYGQLHEEQIARIARGQAARRVFHDPVGPEDARP